MAIKPSVYVAGAQPPHLPTDPGAGAWKSVPETLGMKTLKEVLAATPVTALASHFGGADAVRHLLHYLSNSGKTLTIDFERLVREVPIAAQALQVQIDAAKAYVESLPAGRHYFTSTTGSLNHYITKSQSVNWFFAVGSYTTWGKGAVTVQVMGSQMSFDLEFECRLFDRYNWDGGKKVDIPIPGYASLPGPAKQLIDALPHVNHGQLRVTDHFMGEFHRQGLAKEFDMEGSLARTFSWRKQAPAILYRVRPGDTLSSIAKVHYGDASQWPRIHAANRAVLPNPNLIRVGLELTIPR